MSPLEANTVHPRLRGELAVGAGLISAANGSSPLTRGTHCVCNRNIFDNRFIPAYAGNSRRIRNRNTYRSVHPRLRGELT